MKLHVGTLVLLAACLVLEGCGRQSADGPPEVRLGDSVCDACNMIISDERWATATMVDGPRGAEARLFDDFNCQVRYEGANADLVVLARWSRSHATLAWIRTEGASFLMSPNLRTPMASKTAAFASPTEAQLAQADLTGEVMSFAEAWRRLGYPRPLDDAHQAPTMGETVR